MGSSQDDGADRIRAEIRDGVCDPTSFRAAILGVPKSDRDAWLDRVLELDEIPADDPLPAGCVPYLPSSVDVLLRLAEQASVRASDVFFDIGAGAGRAGAFVHLLTGARVIGVEIQPHLVRASRALAARLGVSSMTCIEGDAASAVTDFAVGSIFFLYCPFSGDRLAKVLGGLEEIARAKTIYVCCVDLPIPVCDWLVHEPPHAPDLAVYRSVVRARGDTP